jgi:hypothetical protein
MSNLRDSITGVVWRNVADDLRVRTIYGTLTVNMAFCECCGTWKPKSEFYLESDSKKKYDGQVRTQCVVCWDQFKGKKPVTSHPVSNTLVSFIS